MGDDDQSISRFRGASVSNILQFQELYKDATEVFLTMNYRSKQNILDLAYEFIQKNNPDRLEAKLSKKGLSKKLQSSHKGKGIITYSEPLDADAEAREVVKTIIELVSSKKVKSLNDIAVLVRSNDAAIPFMQAFSDARIDYQFLASRGLFGKPIIVDVISYFKLLDNYHESTALYRVLTTPFIMFPEAELAKLVNLSRKKQWSLYETLQSYHGKVSIGNDAKGKIIKILKLIEKHTELATKASPQQLFIQVLIDLGIEKYLNDTNTYETYQELWQLQQFYREIADFSAGEDDAHLKEFMEYFSYLLESGERGNLPTLGDEGPEAVSIMTIHSAKRLRVFPCFYSAACRQAVSTIRRREAIQVPESLIREILPEGDTHLQEERRLFYVACTRAKVGLYLSGAKNYGGTTLKKPSQFLVETVLLRRKKQNQRLTLKKVLFTKDSLPEKRLQNPPAGGWQPPFTKTFFIQSVPGRLKPARTSIGLRFF